MNTPHGESEQRCEPEEYRITIPTGKSDSFAEAEWEVIEGADRSIESFQASKFAVMETPKDDFNQMFPDFSKEIFVEDPLLSKHAQSTSIAREGAGYGTPTAIDHSALEAVSSQECSNKPDSLRDEGEQHPLTTDDTSTTSVTEQSDNKDQEQSSPELLVSDAIEEHEPIQMTPSGENAYKDEMIVTGKFENNVEDVSVTEVDGAVPSGESAVQDGSQESHQEGCEVSELGAEESTPDHDPLEDAFEAGYQKGVEESREEIQYAQQQLAEQYTLLWEDMQVQLDELKAEHERKAVDLAMQVAKKLVGKAVSENPEYVVDVIHEALESISNATIKVVRVSPQSYEFLSLGQYGERVKIHGDQKLSFKADESIRAGCIVETSAGETDFDLEKAWTRIYEKIAGGAKT